VAARVDSGTIVREALALLDEVGLDAVSTRALARRIGVEQPSLYCHFRNKAELLAAMAEAAMAPHATAPLPDAEDWRAWFRENWTSFRRTLLLHRDGARLHSGTSPKGDDRTRALRKAAFLVSQGLPEREVRIAMLTAGQFTVGSVLEQQARAAAAAGDDGSDGPDGPDGSDGSDADDAAAFDAGLTLIIDGLARHGGEPAARP
jgi:TetR/AcrR family transcriptional regulator, tetracycline repressor protein